MRPYDFILIGFGALLGFGLEFLRSWIYGRREARRIKARLYKNAELELKDNLDKARRTLEKIEPLHKIADDRVAVSEALDVGPPILDASAYAALENCYFLTEREQKLVSGLRDIKVNLDWSNAKLKNAWVYAERGFDAFGAVKKILEALKFAKEHLDGFSPKFGKLRCYFIRKSILSKLKESLGVLGKILRRSTLRQG